MDTNLSKKLSQISSLSTVCAFIVNVSGKDRKAHAMSLIQGLCMAALTFYDAPAPYRGRAQEDLGNYFWRLLAVMYCSYFKRIEKSIEFDEWARWATLQERAEKDDLSFISYNISGVTLQ